MSRSRHSLLLVLVFVAPPAGHLFGQPTTRVSVDSNGNQGDETSWLSAMSTNGRFVAFQSPATNLVAGDTNNASDIFVHDRVSGRTARVSVSSSGAQAKDNSYRVAISEDGRFVAFSSRARNLVGGDTNGYQDIFRHDRDADSNGIFDEPGGISTIRVSVDSSGAEANSNGDFPAISGDGRFVAFETYASNLVQGDSNSRSDVFVHDCQTGATIRVSVDSAGQQADDDSGHPSLSADGRFVGFHSVATNLVAGDHNNNWDVFLHDRDGDANGIFDEPGGISTIRVSVDSSGGEANDLSIYPSLSADSRTVAFFSYSDNLVPGDTNAAPDIFVHDRISGQTTRVSVDSTGVEGNGQSGFVPAISADGRYVAFPSLATNLVPGDTNGTQDAFVHDRQSGVTTRVNVDSAGNETGDGTEGGGGNPTLSGDGRLVAFDSAVSDLVSGDTNGAGDVFVRDRIELRFNGTPSYPNSVNYTISNANGDTGKLALVMLSCSGISGFPLPDGRIVLLTFDACTVLGFQFNFILSATVDSTGTANTPVFQFPVVPPGISIYSAAVTIDVSAGTFVSLSGPISFVTQ